MTASHSDIPLRRNPEYLRWLTGEVLLGIGAGIGMFAFPLIALFVTGSASAAGAVGFVSGVGLLVGLVPGGVIADRFERKRLVIIGGFLGLTMKVLLITVLITGTADVWVLSAIGFADRLCSALADSASSAMLRQIVTPKQLPAAVAVNQGRESAIELGSGPVGGALLSLHLAFPLVVQAIGHVGSIIMTWLLRDIYRGRPADAEATHPFTDIRDGAAWMVRQPARLQLGIAAALVNLGINGIILTVTLWLAQDGVSPALIGMLSTIMAASMLLGSVAAPKIVAVVPTGLLTVIELAMVAAAAACIPFLPNMWWIAAVFAAVAFGIAPLNAGLMGYFTLITPNELMGRVGAFMGMLTMGLTPLAPFVAGWGLDALGQFGTMLIFAGVCIVALLTAGLASGVRTIPASDGWEAHAREQGLLD